MQKLSVITPVYNREEFMKKMIESVLAQTFRDFEFIIINDGSTDKTKECIEKFDDPRIKYFYQKNSGEYKTTNRALELAQGDYITWVHSDDFLPENSFKLRVEYLNQHPNVDLVHGDIVKIEENGKKKKLIATDDNAKKVLDHYCFDENFRSKRGYFVHHLTFMFRRKLLEKAGFFDPSLPYGGDLDWMMRALEVSKIMHIPEILYYYKRHDKTVSSIAKKEGVPTHEVTRMIQKRYCKNIFDNETRNF